MALVTMHVVKAASGEVVLYCDFVIDSPDTTESLILAGLTERIKG